MDDTYKITMSFESDQAMRQLVDALQDMYDESGIDGDFLFTPLDGNIKRIEFERNFIADVEYIAQEYIDCGEYFDQNISDENIKKTLARQLLFELNVYIDHRISGEIGQIISSLKNDNYNCDISNGQLDDIRNEISSNLDHLDLNAAFLRTAQKGYVQSALIILELGANIHAFNDSDRNALVLAFMNDNNEFADMLLERGFNVEHENESGRSSFLEMSQRDNVASLKKLKELGSNIYKTDLTHKNALMLSCMHGKTENVKWLLEQNYNIHDKDFENNTAIMFAAFEGNVETIDLLLKNGAILTDRNIKNETIFDIAKFRPAVLDFLDSYQEKQVLDKTINHPEIPAIMQF